MLKYWVENMSGNIGAVYFKFATRIVHHKRKKMLCCCHDSTDNLSWNYQFYLTQGSPTTSNLMRRIKTIWEPWLFWAGPSLKGCKWEYLVFDRREVEPRVGMAMKLQMQFVSIVISISGTRFKEHFSNISRVIFLINTVESPVRDHPTCQA